GGGALDFPGGAHAATGPHVELGTDPLGNCTDQLTVATWVRLHAQDAWARVFDFGKDTERFMYLTPFDGQGMHFAMVSPSGPAFDMVTATPPIPGDSTWHHVAVTVAPSGTDETVAMYVDGAVVLTQTNSTGVKVSDFTATTQNY